ncbi:MAG TPA: extracellular solute-binding protein [Candidatus Agrococcus pullicola]|uniref:Extracellular solute-binding protein n=1 Tax=Candidatus Agrococcus pullicola TaxID=2838429 RepID=A0A9D2C9Z3_9MICO|nr:extracellular solute-binding protein [Candidatus Agrococcus pullicola]
MTNLDQAAFRGLTWDHPRGTNALRAAAKEWQSANGAPLIAWDAQPLEGFESAPIDELAARYDLLVMDHPHLGDAIAANALQPLDDVMPAELLRDVAEHTVGPSADSYVAEGRTWALPLDAATQVAAVRDDLVADIPATWAAVVELSRSAPVAQSLAGPHAFLTLCSLAAAFGGTPASLPPTPNSAALESDEAPLFDRETTLLALETMRELATNLPSKSEALNPIGLLERMRATDDIGFIPLIFGYVNYSTADQNSRSIEFRDAPSARTGGEPGSVIGGTGVAVSTRTNVTPELVSHLGQLLSAGTQESFIPAHDGQPSRDSAWESDSVNESTREFYRSTRRTIESSWVRPRFPGYTAFQSKASDLVRTAVLAREWKPARVIDRIEIAYRQALRDAASLVKEGVRQ